jgi:hypothetical protein
MRAAPTTNFHRNFVMPISPMHHVCRCRRPLQELRVEPRVHRWPRPARRWPPEPNSKVVVSRTDRKHGSCHARDGPVSSLVTFKLCQAVPTCAKVSRVAGTPPTGTKITAALPRGSVGRASRRRQPSGGESFKSEPVFPVSRRIWVSTEGLCVKYGGRRGLPVLRLAKADG